jgi:hypothetical protein
MIKSHEDEIEKAGREAFNMGVSGSECPYAYIKSPYWESLDQAGFDREWRWKLDCWMRGWIGAQKESRIVTAQRKPGGK